MTVRWIPCVPAAGPAAGVMDGLEYSSLETMLGPGETMLLYTDGVTEAMNAAGRPVWR